MDGGPLPVVPLLFDRLSLLFIGIILLVSLPAFLHAVGYLRAHYAPGKRQAAWLLMAAFVASMLAVVTAGNAFLFLIAWEIMSLASYFLVVFDDDEARSVRAGTVYIVMTHIGTAAITAAFLILHRHAGSFSLAAFRAAVPALDPATRNLLFALFLAGFGTKAGIVPLHVWLPSAHPQAPSPVSAVMSGVMIKTAVYGMIRSIIGVLGSGPAWWGNLVLALGALSCLVGVIYALMENDLKRLLAFSSIENIGIILLGLGAAMFFSAHGMAAVAVLALAAALYHALNHAVFKSLLFLGAGNVYQATGLRDIEKLGGLIKRMPWTAAAFLAGALAISAVPPFNGFVSEWMMLQALFAGALGAPAGMKVLMAVYAAVLALTGGLAAACFVKAFGITFLALPRSEAARGAAEVPGTMCVPVLFLAAAALGLGLAAGPVLKLLASTAAAALGIANVPAFSTGSLVVMPHPGGAVTLSVPLVVLLLSAAGLAAFLAVRLLNGPARRTAGRTWDCGYYALDARTECTSTAFSKPFRIVFSFFLKPYRKTEQIREGRYHLKSMRYELHTTPVIRRYLYGTVLKAVLGGAEQAKRLQMGSIHFYIAYIFITVVVLILII